MVHGKQIRYGRIASVAAIAAVCLALTVGAAVVTTPTGIKIHMKASPADHLAAAGGPPSSVPPTEAIAAEVDLIKDDGSRENGLVLRDSATSTEFHAVLFNRFSASELAFPFQVDQFEYYADTANITGLGIQLLVYTDQNGPPLTDATLVYTETVTVNTNPGWNIYPLAASVPITQTTDVLIGFSTIYADGGTAWPGDRFPYTMDETDPQGDSYVAWMGTTSDPVDVSDLSSFTNFTEIGDLGFPSNWMIRGGGSFIGSVAALTLDKSVGLDPNVCATDNDIIVGPGTQVTYCYDVSNIGNVTLTSHDLFDDQLGTILSGFPFDLNPGASVFVTTTATITGTTVNFAEWSSPYLTTTVVASDTATVTVAPPDPLVCNGGLIEFEAGIPPDWTVVNNAPGNPVFWSDVAGSGEAANYTGGAGNAASASSDLQGGTGSGLYDTELWSPPIDLTGVGTISLDYLANYGNFAGGDFLDLDISTDGGGSWAPLLSWNEDHHPSGLRTAPGENVSIDLTAYAGEPSVILRWRYYDPTGPASSMDWYAQIDEIGLTCSTGPDITLNKTVGLDPNLCATEDSVVVAPGTDVTYCYEVSNTGTVTLSMHDLVDSELGLILDDFPFDLAPTASVFLTQTANIAASVVNTATWTAFIPGGPSAMASDTAEVIINAPDPVVCNGGAVGFDAGIPPDWSVLNNAAPGIPVEWASIAGAGESGNYTNGTGDAATASSRFQGDTGLYDTELWTPAFDTTGQFIVVLDFTANYQNFGNVDFFEVDVSTDGGGAWTNVLSWNEDHGGFGATPGEDVSLDISAAAANQPSVIIRFHYYDPGASSANDWYAQIDDVSLACTIPVELQSFSIE